METFMQPGEEAVVDTPPRRVRVPTVRIKAKAAAKPAKGKRGKASKTTRVAKKKGKR